MTNNGRMGIMTITLEKSCTGKKRYYGRGAAKEAARRYRARHGRVHKIREYKCPFCDLFHIGHYAQWKTSLNWKQPRRLPTPPWPFLSGYPGQWHRWPLLVASVFSPQWFTKYWRGYNYDSILSFKLDRLFGSGDAGNILSAEKYRKSNHFLHGRGMEGFFRRCPENKGWARGLHFNGSITWLTLISND